MSVRDFATLAVVCACGMALMICGFFGCATLAPACAASVGASIASLSVCTPVAVAPVRPGTTTADLVAAETAAAPQCLGALAGGATWLAVACGKAAAPSPPPIPAPTVPK